MNHASITAYDADAHIPEIYDQQETDLADVELIRTLIQKLGPIKILEPFCGTGRILIPLALDGHTVAGMDGSAGMLERASQKIQQLPLKVRAKISLFHKNVFLDEWPRGFDLVVLGGNCFYELGTPEEQERCIIQAFQALKPGGHLFVDNDHMEGDLAPSWQNLGIVTPSLWGRCSDGIMIECTRETIWFDIPNRMARFRRRTKVSRPDGNNIEYEYIQQKHPVSKAEVHSWLERNSFLIEKLLGDHDGSSYIESSPRAVFWARRT